MGKDIYQVLVEEEKYLTLMKVYLAQKELYLAQRSSRNNVLIHERAGIGNIAPQDVALMSKPCCVKIFYRFS